MCLGKEKKIIEKGQEEWLDEKILKRMQDQIDLTLEETVMY